MLYKRLRTSQNERSLLVINSIITFIAIEFSVPGLNPAVDISRRLRPVHQWMLVCKHMYCSNARQSPNEYDEFTKVDKCTWKVWFELESLYFVAYVAMKLFRCSITSFYLLCHFVVCLRLLLLQRRTKWQICVFNIFNRICKHFFLLIKIKLVNRLWAPYCRRKKLRLSCLITSLKTMFAFAIVVIQWKTEDQWYCRVLSPDTRQQEDILNKPDQHIPQCLRAGWEFLTIYIDIELSQLTYNQIVYTLLQHLQIHA